MSNLTNVTNSCWSLPAAIPSQWVPGNVTNPFSDPFYNASGCAVPVCGTNPSILAKCSNTTVENLSSFNEKGNTTYLSYMLPKNTDASTIQAYQNCMFNNGAIRYLCADPPFTRSSCLSSGISSPLLATPRSGGKYQLCTVQNTINSSEALGSCCQNLQSDWGGCQVSCWEKYENGSTLAQCLTNSFLEHGTSGTWLCTPSDQTILGTSGTGKVFGSTSSRSIVGLVVLVTLLLLGPH